MEVKTEKYLTLGLGFLWLLAGILQLQPLMFTQKFVTEVLEPNITNQPHFIALLISFGIHLFSLTIPLANFLSAAIQVLIGLLLLLPLTNYWKRFGLWISIPWVIIVWIFGEGFGNLFTGTASFYTGAPGSVLLYGIIAFFLLFPKQLKAFYLPQITGILFFLGGILQMLPMFWMQGMQTMTWQMSQGDTVPFIAAPAKLLATTITSTLLFNCIAVALLLLLGLLLYRKPTKLIGGVALLFLFFVWWISQDFGAVLTFPLGLATDPNSAPLFALMLLPIFTVHKKNV